MTMDKDVGLIIKMFLRYVCFVFKRHLLLNIILLLGCIMSPILFSDPSYAQKSVEQKSTGDESPNIYAPQAKMLSITYGVSEKLIIDLMEQLKGKDKIIGSLLEDLKGKDVTIRGMEAQIKNWTTMVKELNKQIAESTPAKKTSPLIPLTPYDFLDNFIIFHQYMQYRKTLELLNPEMLIKLLNVYFRSVLLYPSNTKKEYYITARTGELMRLQILGHNEKGEKITISLPDMSASLLPEVCMDFVKSADSRQYEMMESLFESALSTPELEKVHKMNILDARNFIEKNKLLLNK